MATVDQHEGDSGEETTARAWTETRRDQLFPRLADAQIDRIRPFAEARSFPSGAPLFETGKVGAGMFVLLSGTVVVTRRNALGATIEEATHGAGTFLAEVGQLSGRPALVDGRAEGEVAALVLPPDQLRRLIVADAELGEMIMRALILRRVSLIEKGAGGPVLIGGARHPDVVRLDSFLARNGQPHTLLDPETDETAAELVRRFAVDSDDLPLAICPNGTVLRNPSEAKLGHCLGMDAIDTDRTYDVAIVGAGPAGLAAAVYAASEGLAVAVFDTRAFGGQAGASMRIENYLGFPTGITGQALAGRAFVQAQKFGAEIAIPAPVAHIRCGEQRLTIELADGRRIRAKAMIAASGAAYRRPDVPNLQRYEGKGVYYWASPIEAKLCAGAEVALVGGGNSAGQAAVFLAGHVGKVNIVVRRPLEETMSRYLVDRLAALANVEVHVGAEIAALHGSRDGLTGVSWRNLDGSGEDRCDTRFLFLFIGADPNTNWLGECDVVRDGKGFVLTGDAIEPGKLAAAGWTRERAPAPLETSIEGVFAIGDVRAGSVKRVAAAVGEGAAVVAQLHALLAERSNAASGAHG